MKGLLSKPIIVTAGMYREGYPPTRIPVISNEKYMNYGKMTTDFRQIFDNDNPHHLEGGRCRHFIFPVILSQICILSITSGYPYSPLPTERACITGRSPVADTARALLPVRSEARSHDNRYVCWSEPICAADGLSWRSHALSMGVDSYVINIKDKSALTNAKRQIRYNTKWLAHW